MSDFVVTLEPHVGTMQTKRGPVPVVFKQKLVMLNGVEVGLIGDQPNAGLCLNVRLDPTTAAHLQEEVAKLKGAPVPLVAMPPAPPDQE